MNRFLSDLIERYPLLNECVSDIERSYSILAECYRSGNKALLCGNGGSAADADHWSAELLKGFCRKRPLKCGSPDEIPLKIAENLQRALPAIPLTGFMSLSTAFANDNDGDYTFAQLIFALGKPGDVLVGISTSGNSPNVIHAIRTASALGLKTIGLSGADGGAMVGLVDACIRVPARKTHEIQELHLPVYHALSMMLEEEFFGGSD